MKTQSLFAVALGAVICIGTSSAALAASNGKSLFDTNCSTCHGGNGQGQPSVFPPLAHNPDETAKDPTAVIKIVLHGLNVPKTIMGKQYSGGMPAWSNLSDEDIAAILTYIRSSWGNKAAPITAAQVKAARK